MSGKYADAWGLDDATDRDRFVKAPRGQTELISFRVYTHHARVLDEIIHSGIDPRLKTKSDCMQDAVAMFIEDWLTNFQDGISGRTLRMYQYEREQLQQRSRQDFLTKTDELVEAASGSKDIRVLEMVRVNLQAELDDDAVKPEYFIRELERRIDRLREWLSWP